MRYDKIEKKPLSLEEKLALVDYNKMKENLPTDFTNKFITFVHMVNGDKGEENETPVFHIDLLNSLAEGHQMNLFVAFRGSAKSSLCGEYMILYLAAFHELPGMKDIHVGVYISDTMENGVKNMRKNLEYRYNNSEFLKAMIPKATFTESDWEFENANGKKLFFRGLAVKTGFRGFKAYGTRPKLCIFDDLMSDKNATSERIVEDIEQIIYSAAFSAMHTEKKFIWVGTPFNKKDPLYKAASGNAWHTKVYPICQKFPVRFSEMQCAWEDRYDYTYIANAYQKLKDSGQIDGFNKELMLIVASEEDRLIQDDEIRFMDTYDLIKNKEELGLNFYITTDFAVSENQKSDFNVILVWTYTDVNGWILVDGFMERCNINDMIDEIFKYGVKYNGMVASLVLESSGQQQGFGDVIEKEMTTRQVFLPLYRRNGNSIGVKGSTSKLTRFNTVVPLFKQGRIHFSESMKSKIWFDEALDQIKSVTFGGIKSAHDDFLDPISQLVYLAPTINEKPVDDPIKNKSIEISYNNIYNMYDLDEYYSNPTGYDSYI